MDKQRCLHHRAIIHTKKIKIKNIKKEKKNLRKKKKQEKKKSPGSYLSRNLVIRLLFSLYFRPRSVMLSSGGERGP